MDSYQPAVSTKFQEQTTCGPVPKHIPMQWKISISETISTKNKSLPWRHHVSQTGTRPQHTLQDLLPNILSSENKGSFLMHFPFCISLNFCREPCLRTQIHLPASKPGTAFMYSPGHPILPLRSPSDKSHWGESSSVLQAKSSLLAVLVWTWISSAGLTPRQH